MAISVKIKILIIVSLLFAFLNPVDTPLQNNGEGDSETGGTSTAFDDDESFVPLRISGFFLIQSNTKHEETVTVLLVTKNPFDLDEVERREKMFAEEKTSNLHFHDLRKITEGYNEWKKSEKEVFSTQETNEEEEYEAGEESIIHYLMDLNN